MKWGVLQATAASALCVKGAVAATPELAPPKWDRGTEHRKLGRKVELDILDLVIAGLTIDFVVSERQGDVPAHLPYVPIVTRGDQSRPGQGLRGPNDDLIVFQRLERS